MTNTNDRPPLAVYVAWHSEYPDGDRLAQHLRQHWSADAYQQVLGPPGVSVLPLKALAPSGMPPIDWDRSHAVAVVVLLDHRLAREPAWRDYLHRIVSQAEDRGYAHRVFPVAMEPDVLKEMDRQFTTQALCWSAWDGPDPEREERLLRDLLHQFSRMLQYLLDSPTHPQGSLRAYMDARVRLFISYARQDDHGKATAEGIRNWIGANGDLGTFLDIHDIPSGTAFDEVITEAIRNGALVVCYSDSYSSREWCRREVLLAKRHDVPMIVVDCLRDVDQRLFPYIGNVPVMRVDPKGSRRIDQIVLAVLDEVLRSRLWQCRVAALSRPHVAPVFTSRKPELCLLSTFSHMEERSPAIVYPGLPIGAEEKQLFSDIDDRIGLHTLDDWSRRQSP